MNKKVSELSRLELYDNLRQTKKEQKQLRYLQYVLGILATIGFLAMIGSVGSIEQDTITLGKGFVLSLIGMTVFFVSMKSIEITDYKIEQMNKEMKLLKIAMKKKRQEPSPLHMLRKEFS